MGHSEPTPTANDYYYLVVDELQLSLYLVSPW